MTIKLHEKTRHGIRVITFKSARDRGRYLARAKNQARAARKQFTFKRNEYLRVYENSMVFYELDIVKPKVTKESLNHLFKPVTVS